MVSIAITDALHRNLQLLTSVRSIVAIGQALALFYFSSIEDIGLELRPLISVLVLMCGFTALTWWRITLDKPVSELEFFVHLSIDMLALALMVYYSGGASNPFVSYLLVPIAIGSSILRWHYSAALAVFGLAAYSLLIFYHTPVHTLMSHGDGHNNVGGVSLHLAGMWLNFVVSALLIAYFIVRMAGTIKQQRQQLANQREKKLESDRLISVATLAANTAHQLGTPINSISLLARELSETDPQEKAHPALKDLQTQVFRCKEILQSLVNTADLALKKEPQPVVVNSYFIDLLNRWSVLHPQQAVILDKTSIERVTEQFLPPQSLEPAIFNLLNNAAESGADQIKVGFEFIEAGICMLIEDNGCGIPENILEHIGQPFNSNKPDGMGIGIYLAVNTVNSMGGSLQISSVNNGVSNGTLVRLNLPIIEYSLEQFD